MSTGKVLLGVMAGVAIGALLGVLFAPDKGSVTRKKIIKTGEDLKDDVKESFNEFLDDLSEKFEKVKDDVSDVAGKARSGSEKTEKEAKTAKA